MSAHSLKIAICSYGAGNPRSIYNMITYIGYDVSIIRNPRDITAYDLVIIPGVGSFDFACQKLSADGWKESILSHADKSRKILGICLGMQILCESSEEGDLEAFSYYQVLSRSLNLN